MRAPVLLVILLAGACSREPREWDCPSSAAGDLAFSELRGPQSGMDTYGQWIELHNHTAAEIPMAGVVVRMVKLDGSGEVRLVVRSHELAVPAHGYFVLGRAAPGQEPAHVDYGYADDFDGDLYEGAILEVRACDTVLDRITYNGLPTLGSFAFDGALEPDATANDAEGTWCTDAALPVDGGPATDVGVPGTPGERNRPCL